MWRRILILYVFLVNLHLRYAVRISVDKCPETATAWNTRSKAFSCKSKEVYHCLQDGKKNLMETCMKAYNINPSVEGGCPWALHFPDGESILSSRFYPCQGNGCPQNSDSAYWTNELYKYPRCLKIYDETTKVKEIMKSETESTSKRTVVSIDINIPTIMTVTVLAVALILLIALMYTRTYRKINLSGFAERDIEDPKISLMCEDETYGTATEQHRAKTYVLPEPKEGDGTLVNGVAECSLLKKEYIRMKLCHSAGLLGSIELVKYLVDDGFDVYSKEEDGRTIVHNACQKGHVNLVKYLIDKKKGALNIKDNCGMTPFLLAGFSGSVELVQYLIGNGCDVYSKDNKGMTIMHFACQTGHVNLVKFLVDKDEGVFNLKDNDGLAPFHAAGFSGSVKLVQYLMDKGCDVYSKDKNGQTIVHKACDKGHLSLVKYLINKSKGVLHIKDNSGLTPFHSAGFSGSVELVQYLINNGCDVYSQDNDGRTIVHSACREGHFNLVQYLIQKDKGVLNLKDSNGLTPFHLAGYSGSVKLVRYLIYNGCVVYSKK